MATTSVPSVLRSTKEAEMPVQQVKENDKVHNPYLAARKEWDERYGDLISRARNWRAAFFVAAAIALLAVEIGRAHVLNSSHHAISRMPSYA